MYVFGVNWICSIDVGLKFMMYFYVYKWLEGSGGIFL